MALHCMRARAVSKMLQAGTGVGERMQAVGGGCGMLSTHLQYSWLTWPSLQRSRLQRLSIIHA